MKKNVKNQERNRERVQLHFISKNHFSILKLKNMFYAFLVNLNIKIICFRKKTFFQFLCIAILRASIKII